MGLRRLGLISTIVDDDRKMVGTFGLARDKIASAEDRLDSFALSLRFRKAFRDLSKRFNLFVSKRVIDRA